MRKTRKQIVAEINKRSKKPAIRKPRDSRGQKFGQDEKGYFVMFDFFLSDKTELIRKRAAWLLSAADYLEFSQNMKKRKIRK